ncbi:MAG: Rrf2 family transcriptional regulator [Bacteroidales bacterium]|nr:Rrf2 family transcriptional regulator [Bacteroidales bacterium]
MLSRSTEYALRALVYVQLKNWEGKRPGIIEISREIESPAAFTAKILQLLARHRLLQSMKGRGGGFFFDEEKDELNLFKVVVTIEGDSFFHKCGFGLKNCSNENPCPLHDRFVRVRDEFREIVESETIQSLAAKVKDGSAVLNRMINNKN